MWSCVGGQISDVGMISVARGCTVLSAVVANRCPNITDATVAAFGKYSIDLARLSVKGCATITDTGLKVRGVCPQPARKNSGCS